jgi:hypothetical protein
VRVPLYGFGGAGALFAIALLYSRSTADEGLLAAVGDTSILVLYPVLGFVGGSLLGGAAAVRDSLDFFERQFSVSNSRRLRSTKTLACWISIPTIRP